jgi:phosphoribosylglycinamide formyltransferase-1
MAALIRAAQAPEYPAEIVLVLSNKASAPGLAFAAEHGIETAVIPHKGFVDRESFDLAMTVKLERSQVDLVCLAGFMRLLSADFCRQWEGRLMNVHPALLPAFKGLDTHRRALASGVKIHGATVHFVTPEMDGGPIIAQAAVPVFDSDTEEALAERVLAQEHRIYPLALDLVASGAVQIDHGRTRCGSAAVAGQALISPATTR